MQARDFSKEFTAEEYGKNLDEIQTLFQNMGFDNFQADVRQVTIPAGTEVQVPHRLKRVPKYRIIVRQDDANALVTDGLDLWTESFITLKNQGGVETTVTVLILRG